MPDTQLGQPQKTTAEILRHYFLTDEDVKNEYVCLLANGRSMSWILENINDELERLHPEAHRSSFSSLRKVWVGLGLPTQQQAAMARLPAASHPSLDDPCFEHLISSERDTLADWSDEPDGIDPLDGHDDELILDPEKMMDSLSPPVETPLDDLFADLEKKFGVRTPPVETPTRTGAEPAAAVARPSVADELEAALQGAVSKDMGLYLASLDAAMAANPVLAAEVAALEEEITAEMKITEAARAAQSTCEDCSFPAEACSLPTVLEEIDAMLSKDVPCSTSKKYRLPTPFNIDDLIPALKTLREDEIEKPTQLVIGASPYLAPTEKTDSHISEQNTDSGMTEYGQSSIDLSSGEQSRSSHIKSGVRFEGCHLDVDGFLEGLKEAKRLHRSAAEILIDEIPANVWDGIEAALGRGVEKSRIADLISECGLPVTAKSFSEALRLRSPSYPVKKRRSGKRKPRASAVNLNTTAIAGLPDLDILGEDYRNEESLALNDTKNISGLEECQAPARPTRKSRAAPAWIKDLRKSFRPPKAAPKSQEDVADIIAKELSGRRARSVLGELVLSRASTVENVARWLKERFERENPKARKTSVKHILVLWREAGLPVRGKRNWRPSGN